MTKSTPLSQIPRSQVNTSNNTDTQNKFSGNNDTVVLDDEDDSNINIEEVLQQEKMTNSNILSLQQQIESLKNEIEKKNMGGNYQSSPTPMNTSTLSSNNVTHQPQITQTVTNEQQPSIITKDSVQGVLFHLKNLNYTSIIITFVLVIITYSEYVDNLLLSKLEGTKYELGIPYIKALFVAIVISFLYKN